MSFVIIYFIVISVYHLGKQYLPVFNKLLQLLIRLPKKNPFITACIAISCMIAIHPEQHVMNKILSPLVIGEVIIEDMPQGLLQPFKVEQDHNQLLELIKQLMRFSMTTGMI